MVVRIGLHGMDKAQIIHMLRDVRHQLADPHAALPTPFKPKRAFQDHVIAAMEDVCMACPIQGRPERFGDGLSIQISQCWLVVERVDL